MIGRSKRESYSIDNIGREMCGSKRADNNWKASVEMLRRLVPLRNASSDLTARIVMGTVWNTPGVGRRRENLIV